MTDSDLSRAVSSQYSVERELGGGGMSRVFLAFDESLGRRIVVKVLHPELAAAVSVERFRREIRVAAKLAHPHIVPLLNAGDVDGLPYYTMPYIEGESLRERLKRDNRLPLSEAMRIATEVANALDYAHRQGIIHRDIKPENILMQEGHAVVTDFGIARAVSESATKGTLTQIGVTIGTPMYMSPEQAAGDADLDARADVYSLGCVLFEMLAGTAPYKGDGPRSLIAQHFSAPVPRVRAVRGEVPTALETVIASALAKEPSQRCESAAQFAKDIQGAASTPGRDATAGESIAVLPFANLSAGAENDYLSDGITEEILNALTRLKDVKVAARSSAFSFKGQQQDVREVAARLGVRHVLQGSVQRAGNRLRVTAQLVDAGTGFQAWSDKYDRELRDIFAIQDDIAEIIAARLEAQFKSSGRVRRSVGIDAYDEYLRGRFHMGLGTVESWRRSVESFEKAIAMDRDFADAHVGLAQALCYLSFGETSPDTVSRAKAAAARALELDADHADATAVSGFCKCWFDWDFAGAHADMRRAIELNPGSATAHYNLTILLANLGESDGAIRHGIRVVELDPLWSNAHQALQWALMTAGRYAEALDRARLALELAPGSINALFPLSWASVEVGDLRSAIDIGRQIQRQAPFGPMGIGTLAVAHARAGDRGEASRMIGELERAPRTAVSCAYLAWANAAIGQVDKAFEWLDAGIDTKDQFMGCMPVFAWWDPLRTDPRFLEAMKRAGFPDWCYRRTHEFLGATRAKSAETARTDVKAIVVLPFTNLSTDADTEFFSDGLSEELITDLSRVGSLRVISRVSARSLKGTTKDLRAIGRDLDVQYAVSGSVRRAGKDLRVTSQLVEIANESELWAERFAGNLEEVFDIQERLSRRIVEALKAKLTPEESKRLAARPIANADAYACYLKAWHEVRQETEAGALQAIQTATHGLDLVGDNALLYGVLGHAHLTRAMVATDQGPILAEAKRCATLARTADPGSAYPDFLQGFASLLSGDMQSAVRHLKEALRIEPQHTDSMFWLIEAYVVAGKCDAARPLARNLVDLDPINPHSVCMPGFVEAMDGNFPGALGPYRKMYALAPDNPFSRWSYAFIIAWNGMVEEACQVLDAVIRDAPNTFWAKIAQFRKPALLGDRDQALKAVTPELNAAAKCSPYWSFMFGQKYAMIGELEQALEWLENAVHLGFINHPLLSKHDPHLANLRGNRNFAKLMERVRARWEAFEP